MAQNSKWFENDISLLLTPSQKNLVEEWLPKFIEARRNHFGAPTLKNNRLEIGAPDLLEFLSFVEFSADSEFDLTGIKKSLEIELQSFVKGITDVEQLSHYNQMLDLLKSFDIRKSESEGSSNRFKDFMS